MRWGALLLLLSSSVLAFDLGSWVADLDQTRANLLAEARVNIGETEPAEDTELEFSMAATAISVSGTAVTLGYFLALGDVFQVCVDVNANTTTGSAEVRSCFEYDRNEIEK